MCKVMENVCHGPLECGTSILEDEWHNTVSESTPWGSKCGLVLILRAYLDLVVSRESIHQGEGYMADKRIHYLIDKRCQKIIFRTCTIQIMEIYTYVDGTLFFGDRDWVRDPRCVLDGEDEFGLS